MIIKNLKYNIYQKSGYLFPVFFKNRAFRTLKDSINPNSSIQPAENELYILHLLVDSKSTILDVGANNGLYCYYFQEFVKCKEIHAFEPIPSLFKKLEKWFKNIHFYPFAISNENAIKTLRIPYIHSVKFETRAKLDDLIETDENHFDELKIQARTLDTIFLDRNIHIDFIKIDIEGHELSAIEGAKEIIANDHPILMIEIEERHHGDKFNEIISSIEKLGYKCCFFNKEKQEVESFVNFDLLKHQSLNNQIYINNFLFFPIDFSLEKLNKQIKEIFNS